MEGRATGLEGRADALETSSGEQAAAIGALEPRVAACEASDAAQNEALTVAFGASGAIAIETAPGVAFAYTGSVQNV